VAFSPPYVVARVRDASRRRFSELLVERERAFLSALDDVSNVLHEEGDVDDTLRLVARREGHGFAAEVR
jgi:hypothetical protein